MGIISPSLGRMKVVSREVAGAGVTVAALPQATARIVTTAARAKNAVLIALPLLGRFNMATTL